MLAFIIYIKGEVPLEKSFEDLSKQIEQKRESLHQQVSVHQDLSHPEIIKLSQELDKLLNEMNRLYKKKMF